MRYEKPIVMDLNGRLADGQSPQLCYPGSVANASGEVCVNGGTARYYHCFGGNGDEDCLGGSSPGNLDCYSGGSAGFCETGGAVTQNDPGGCRAGPSVTP